MIYEFILKLVNSTAGKKISKQTMLWKGKE